MNKKLIITIIGIILAPFIVPPIVLLYLNVVCDLWNQNIYNYSELTAIFVYISSVSSFILYCFKK